MADNTCNGWTNHATWLVNVWTDGDSEISYLSRSDNGTLYDRAQALKEYVTEFCIHTEGGLPTGLVNDLLSSVLCDVDWYELVRHYEDCEDETEGYDSETDRSN